MAFVTGNGAEVIVQPDGVGSTKATSASMSVYGHAPGDTILVTSPTSTGAIQTATFKPSTQNEFNSLLAQWQQELRAQYAGGPCSIGVQGHNANFTFTGPNAQTWCARLLQSTGYQYLRLAGPLPGKMDRVCTVQLDGAVVVAQDTGGHDIAGDVCNQLRNMAAGPVNADWDTAQAAASAQDKTILALSDQLRQAIATVRDQTGALKDADSTAKSAAKETQGVLTTMQKDLATEKKDAATKPMTCYVAGVTVPYDYNVTLHYDYTVSLVYQRNQFANAADAAAKAEAAGAAAAKQASDSAATLQRATSVAKYPVPGLKAQPGDEKAVIDAFNTGVQAAHADLDPLKAADNDVQQQADGIMADGQGVLDGATAAAGHC